MPLQKVHTAKVLRDSESLIYRHIYAQILCAATHQLHTRWITMQLWIKTNFNLQTQQRSTETVIFQVGSQKV